LSRKSDAEMNTIKRVFLLCLTLFSLLLVWAGDTWSWCWIRDTGLQSCTGGSQQKCCSGNLRIWQNSAMTYQISTSTNSSLNASVEQGFNLWTDIEMSNFTFTKGSATTESAYQYDGTNLINIDSQFCTHNPSDCNQGVLGFSGCWTASAGSPSYRAVECDIIMNGEEYNWGSGSSGTINTVAVVAHEAGHNAGISHPGSTCRSAGSSGCGPEVASATMYWNYSLGTGNKSTLELDDVAALVYGYPRSTVRIRVVDGSSNPVAGATVELLDTAAPFSGNDIATGGQVRGDVNNSAVRFGDKVDSLTYINSTPVTVTDASGYTNYITPIHPTFRVRATSGSSSVTQTITPSQGQSTVTVTLSGGPVCTYSILPTSATGNASGGSGSIAVTASAGTCAWTAVSNVAWLTITSGSSGTGNGSVGYSYTANNTVSTRTGTITIGGQTFTLTEEPETSPLDTQLSNGVAVNQTMTAPVGQGTTKYYYFDLASGSSNLVADLYNLTGDLDLYVRQGSKPTLSSYDCRPYTEGLTSESCSFSSPASGRWWIGVTNWATGTFSYTIKALWSDGVCSGDTVVLQNMTFATGNTYNCTATTSITAGTGVTVKSGATVNFRAPKINLQPGFRVESGAVFSAKP
jgi:hypothetical protein